MKTILAAFVMLSIGLVVSRAQGLDPALQPKIDAYLKEAQSWAADARVVAAVKAHNGALPADAAAMNQDKWKGLSVLDPFVRSFTRNEAGEFLKTKRSDVVVEAFLSGAEGLKVAFLAKTSSWSHKGKAKHDVPMTGKTWTGPVEVDESTGQQQIQIAVPVLDGGKPVGSLVIGLSVSKLGKS